MPYLQNIVQPFSRKKKQDLFLSTYICTILVFIVQLVGLLGLHLQWFGLSCGSCGSGGLGGLGGSGWCDLSSWAKSGYFLAIRSDPKVFSNGNIVFDDPK